MAAGLCVLVVIVVLCGECKAQVHTTTHSPAGSEPMDTNDDDTDTGKINGLMWEHKAWADWHGCAYTHFQFLPVNWNIMLSNVIFFVPYIVFVSWLMISPRIQAVYGSPYTA